MKSITAFIAFAISIFSIIAGILSGLGTFAYGIFTVVLLCKGTLALTFWSVCKAVAFICGATLVGYVVFAIFALLAAAVACLAK